MSDSDDWDEENSCIIYNEGSKDTLSQIGACRDEEKSDGNLDMDWQKYERIVDPTLFRMFSGKPMYFYFRIEDEELKSKWENLVIKCGGKCVSSFLDMNERTAFMVPDECPTKFYSKPSFKTSYIKDCIEKKTLLDISDYLHNNTYFSKCDLYMNVIFRGTHMFSVEEKTLMNKVEGTVAVDKRTRCPFTYKEKEAILKYIILSNRTTGLNSDVIWKAMERDNVCPIRTYQSMKNHFRRKLVYELDKFEFLTEKQKKNLRHNAHQY